MPIPDEPITRREQFYSSILGDGTPTPLRPAFEVHGTIQTKYGQPDGEIETFWIQTNGEVKGFTMTEWTNIRGSICYPVGY